MNRLLPLVIASGFALAFGAVVASARNVSSLPAPSAFALEDIAGEWHILAHIPYFIERDRVAPTIRFDRRDDGRYDERFTSRKGSFEAKAKTFKQVTWAPNPARPWQLKTRLFFVIPARYSVLELDQTTGIALLGTEKRDKAWIFSRSPTLDPASYGELLERFERMGFDKASILRIPQSAGDLGKPGYAPIER